MNEEIDEFQGQGGAYVVDDPKNAPHKRRQVEKPTQDHPEGNTSRDWDHMPLIGGIRKDDLDDAIDAFHKKHGRAAEHHEVGLIHAHAKQLAKERSKERAAKLKAYLAERDAKPAESSAAAAEPVAKKGGDKK